MPTAHLVVSRTNERPSVANQIVDERFLVYVNDLLTSGVIPDLFTKEEFDSIFQAIRIAAKSAGVPDVRDSLMQFFVDRYRMHASSAAAVLLRPKC